jgi:hypothetical protein
MITSAITTGAVRTNKTANIKMISVVPKLNKAVSSFAKQKAG